MALAIACEPGATMRSTEIYAMWRQRCDSMPMASPVASARRVARLSFIRIHARGRKRLPSQEVVLAV
jgi:hypothetical protein